MINFDKDCIIEAAYRYLYTPQLNAEIGEYVVNDELKGEFIQWEMSTMLFLIDIFGNEHWMVQKFNEFVEKDKNQCKITTVHAFIGILNAFQKYEPNDVDNSEFFLINVFDNFSNFAGQLSKRHNNRASIEIYDEYDVQDLLHAILLLYFDDVRAEEWIPSYAGGNKRMDFLLTKVSQVKNHERDFSLAKL